MLIDLNCDLGEGAGSDADVIPLVTTANVACGFHASDPATAFATIALAAKHGVRVGAHPSFPVGEDFGRREIERTEQQILVRQVTDYQASWTEEERGEPGRFTFQLILDNGAEEYVIRPTVGDAKVIRKLLDRSDAHTFDLQRKILIFSNIHLGG